MFRGRQRRFPLELPYRRFAWTGVILVLAVVLGGLFGSASTAAAAAPNTRITSGPTGSVATRSVTFTFTASRRGASFRCKLDAAPWLRCTTPKRYARLAQGSHTFRVRAGKNGDSDPTPAKRTFRVDTVKPDTTILSGPTGTSQDRLPVFTFSGSESGTFECRLAETAFIPCASPYTPGSELGDDFYTFRVRARDRAGNVDATPATRAFAVDTPLTNDSDMAKAAAELYFPDSLDLDAGGGRLQIVNSRFIAHVSDYRWELRAAQDVQTTEAMDVEIAPVTCGVTLNSWQGSSGWFTTLRVSFEPDLEDGKLRIVPDGLAVEGVEVADISLASSAPLLCLFVNPAALRDAVENLYLEALAAHIDRVGPELCAAPGPELLGPCPP